MLRATRLFMFLAPALLLVLAGGIRADVDVAVGNGDKVSGTLLPADEVESYRVLVPAGSIFKLKVKGKPLSKGKPKPPVTLRLFDPDGLEVGASSLKVKKTSATLKGYEAALTGEYRIQVAGDGATSGNYLLVVKWSSQKKFVFDLTDTGPGDPSRVAVPLDAGALLNITLKAAKGSPATPIAEKIEAAGDFERTLKSPRAGSSSHKLKKLPVPVFGEATVQASGGGAYKATVVVKPPKLTKRKIDLSERVIGGDPINGGAVAFGEVIGPAGGALAVSADDSEIIGGSSVTLPPGALASPTAVLVGTASPMPAQDTGDQPAGPTVFFGPEGLQFMQDVTVTIPFDVEAFAASSGALTVFTRDEDGNVTEITDFTFDLDTGTCTFQASHFSSFRVFGPQLPEPVQGDIDFDGKGDLVLRAPGNGGGRVYVVPGDAVTEAIATTADAPIVLSGEGSSGEFGEIVATGDLNQDGREDLVVTAPSAGLNGRVYVFLGASDFASRDAVDADVIIFGQQRDLGFGVRLALGDVNGDGIDDLVVGAEGSSAGVGGAGAAYVFFGAPEISSRSSEHADVTLTGGAAGDGFGAAVAIGEVTGDGFADVIVGADQVVGGGSGAVYVFAGGPDLKSLQSKKADFSMTGAAPRDAYGLEIAVGDVTGDGIDEVVVAAAGSDAAGVDAGAVYVHFGGNLEAPPAELTGEAGGDDFGFNVAVRDLDDIAGAEVVVTADRTAGGRGKAYIFGGGAGFGSQGAASATSILTGEANGNRLSVLQHPWDASDDGVADLIVYAPQAASAAGRAYVFVGGGTLPATGSVGAQADAVIEGQSGEALGGEPPIE